MGTILIISVLINLIFVILALRVFYYGRQMWVEINDHDKLIDSLYEEKNDLS